MRLAGPVEFINIWCELALQRVIDLAGFTFVRSISNLVRSRREHMHDAHPSPGAHAEISRIDITKPVQSIHRRIDPAVYWHISRPQRRDVLAWEEQHVLATRVLGEAIGERQTEKNKRAKKRAKLHPYSNAIPELV